MVELLMVGLGGFVGAIARYSASTAVQRQWGTSFPWGTLTVNLLGCLLIGLTLALVEARPHWPPHVRAFLVVGLLGAFTTFSTFGHETLELLRSGQWTLAVSYVAGSAIVGLLAVVAGRTAGRLF